MGLTIRCTLVSVLDIFIQVIKTPVNRELTVNRWQVVDAGAGSQRLEITVASAVAYQFTEPEGFRTVSYRVLVDIAKIDDTHRAALGTVREFPDPDQVRAEITF